MLGYDEQGTGATKVLILHDWMCDTSSWDWVRPLLDGERFTWVFADLRGYGRSRQLQGTCDLHEATRDVITLVDMLGWQQFAIVGHSMSCFVSLHLAQQMPERITAGIAFTPGPPTGLGIDDATLAAMEQGAGSDDATRMSMMAHAWGPRLTERWSEYKAARWRATSDPRAVVAYLRMFAQQGLPDPKTKITVPVLVVTGEHDNEAMRRASVTKLWSPLCERFRVEPLADCGHYPMQEAPPLTATILERFIGALDPR